MITLSLLKFLEVNGYGEIDKSLFFQKLGLGRVGVYISNTSDVQARGSKRSQSYELYSRGNDDVDGHKRLSDIIKFLHDSYGVCRLPAVPPITDEEYDRVTIMPPSSISNAGMDANGRTIYSASGAIYY